LQRRGQVKTNNRWNERLRAALQAGICRIAPGVRWECDGWSAIALGGPHASYSGRRWAFSIEKRADRSNFGDDKTFAARQILAGPAWSIAQRLASLRTSGGKTGAPMRRFRAIRGLGFREWRYPPRHARVGLDHFESHVARREPGRFTCNGTAVHNVTRKKNGAVFEPMGAVRGRPAGFEKPWELVERFLGTIEV